MSNRLIPSAAFAALIMIVAFAPARAAEPTAKISNYGVYEIRQSGTTEKADRTVAGELRPVDAHRLIEKTDEVVGQLGNTFGIEVDLNGLPEGPVTLVIRTIHPPLTNSETGKTMTVSEFDWTVTQRDNVYFGFTFDYKWEIGEGLWKKQIVYNGKVLAEQTFKVVVPMN
jgi:hypothetical protein